MSYVYAIGQVGSGPEFPDCEFSAVKIGHSINPESRLLSLKTGSSNELKMMACAAVHDPIGMERLLHNLLQTDRVNGEWFKPTKQVLEIVRLLVKVGTTRNTEKPKQVVKPLAQKPASLVKDPLYLRQPVTFDDVRDWLITYVDAWNADVIVEFMESMNARLAQVEYGAQCFDIAKSIAKGSSFQTPEQEKGK